jgi:hypothetical protein
MSLQISCRAKTYLCPRNTQNTQGNTEEDKPVSWPLINANFRDFDVCRSFQAGCDDSTTRHQWMHQFLL